MSQFANASSPDKKKLARKFRSRGATQSEIAKKLDISQSTASVWTNSVTISARGMTRLNKLKDLARRNAVSVMRERRGIEEAGYDVAARSLFSAIKKDKHFFQVICSMLYWAEGGKKDTSVSFINSDPKMIGVFLHSLRKGFDVSESKFRGMVHLHPYHDSEEVLGFWSRVSNIPLSQFSKSYLKSNAGPRKRPNYMGSFRVRYYDTRVAKQLKSIYTTLPDFI